jgi:7-cyano-7-deazaguanine synthase
MLIPPDADSPVAVLLSGGLDSGILLMHLLQGNHEVQPIYVASGLYWEQAELAALRHMLAVLAGPSLRGLVVLKMPIQDVYRDHWSVTGNNVPDAATGDEAVYLPGRNALLLLKPALWCQSHGLSQLALASLKSNPFPDATDRFFESFEQLLLTATGIRVRIWRPLAEMEKTHVMRSGREFPLELTFSCIDPIDGQHCGRCNKCQERRQAFLSAGLADPTAYAQAPLGEPRRQRRCSG